MNSTLVAAVVVLGWGSPSDRPAPVDYLRAVKPILSARCTSCHGSIRQKAGLRLDTAALARKGGRTGAAIEPGQSGESLLIDRVTAEETGERMPPESEGTRLSAEEVAVLRAWIDQGAQAPPEPIPPDPRTHWSYQPVRRPEVPTVDARSRVRNPIDAFLARARQARGLEPVAPADRDVWLRRVWLDLIGLPPTRDALHAFRQDDRPDAERRVVDALLADPRHGERWGRHWMDVWRYSDWYGLGAEVRYSHPHIWRWRDWIVESLNADKGYDRMVVEMLAGDELAPGDPETVRATGFLVRNWDIFNRNVWLATTVEHTSRAFLGVTIQCARCHDHKFDPVSQVDYYRLRAFFEPYHVRIDRVPGQPDRTKDGLVRVFDDFLDRPTYRFVRGDEANPDASRPLTPATPPVLGGEVRIAPVSLPREAASPDSRDFVIREAIEDAERAVAEATKAVEAVRVRSEQADAALAAATTADAQADSKLASASLGTPEEKAALSAAAAAVEQLARARSAVREAAEDGEVAAASLASARARLEALRALIAVERLEDDGAKSSQSEAWAEAARSASAAQRAAALAEALHIDRASRRDADRASRTLDGLLAAATAGDAGKDARGKAATALVSARRRQAVATKQLAQAEKAAKAAPSTTYTPRPREFHRAKTTYRDTPSTAPYSKLSTGRRLALARWLVDRRNPLSARVAVNHIWTRHFGEPLVGSTDDFGLRTPRPELEDLLDWLAVELMESGWSMKHVHRLIVTSDAYRMRSAGTGADDPNARLDPDNRRLWRMNPRRMEAEVVRDSVLALTGRLDPRMGGPDLPVPSAETGNRRTLYYRYANGDSIPLLAMLDAPNVVECYRRHETIVPQQALALSNSGMVLKRSAEIAAAIVAEVGSAADAPTRLAFVESAFERILGRKPTSAERAECLAGLDQLAGVVGGEVRARSALVHVLLNHNDFVTIR